MFEVLPMLATQVLLCLPIGWVEVLDARVLVYISVGLKCWKFCACWPHRYLCACLSVGLKCWKFCGCWMLDAQVLVCLSVGLKCRKFCWESCANTLYVSTIFPSENLAAQVLGVRIDWFEVLEVLEGECCLDNWVGVGTIIHPEMLASLCAVFPSDELAAQVLLVCLHIDWFEVLQVLEGERCLDRCVSNYHPSRDAGFLVWPPVGFVVNTVVTSGGSTIL